MPEPDAGVRAFDQTGDVGDDKPLVETDLDDAQVRVLCREGIIGDLWCGASHAAEQRRFPGVGLSNESHVSDDLQFEPNRAFLAQLTFLMLARSPVHRVGKVLVSMSAASTPRHDDRLANVLHVSQKIATLDVVNQRSDRDANDRILSTLAGFQFALAVHPTFGIPVLVPDQMRQIRELVSRLDDDSSPTTAIAAVWTAARNVSLAPKTQAPIAAVTTAAVQLDLIQKHPRISIIPDFPVRRSTGAANSIGPLEALRSEAKRFANPAFELRSPTGPPRFCMSDSHAQHPVPQDEQPTRQPIPRKAIAAAVLLGLMTPVIYVWYFTPPDVIAEPVHFSRDDSGTLVADDDSATDGARLKSHLGKLNARNKTSMVSSEVHSNPAFLATNRLLILNQCNHLLIARVATSLLDLLKQDSPFNEIDYFPIGEQPDVGGPAPDLYLTLDLTSIDESGLIGRDLKAQVTAHFGTSLAESNYNSHDNQSPPTVSMRADIGVDHESELMGVESSAAKYTLQGDDIAKQISKHILDKLKKLREKNGPLPEMPAALYPNWTVEPNFAFLDRLQAKRLSGFRGLMLHNESLWRYQPTGDPIETVTAIRDELLADGWKEDNFYDRSAEHFSLQMSKGDETLGVFPKMKVSVHNHQPHNTDDGAETTEPNQLNHFVRYRHRQSLAGIRSVVDELFAVDRPDINLLLAMQSNWQGEQHSRAISLIEEHGVRSADAWLLVARSYSRRKDVEGTRRALACCRFLAQTMTNPGDVDQKIKKIAKEHDIDEKLLGKPDESLLNRLGFVALDSESAPTGSTTVRFGEPAAFYLVDEADKLTMLVYTVEKLPQPDRYRITTLEATGRSRSWTTGEHSSFEHLGSRNWKGYRLRPHVEEKTPETLEFEITLVSQEPRKE